MNTVLMEHIKHISETRTRFEKIKRSVSNWRNVIIFSIIAMTLKVAAEQIAMVIR